MHFMQRMNENVLLNHLGNYDLVLQWKGRMAAGRNIKRYMDCFILLLNEQSEVVL
jgi:hypothetical protein